MFKKLISATEYIVPILDVALTPDKKGIKSRTFIGTGVFISNDTILTCKQVLQSAENTRCIVGNIFKSNENLQYIGLGYINEHNYADIATAKIKKDYANPFKPMEVVFNQEIISGKEVLNYCYVEACHPDYRIPVIPRLNRGSIMKISKDKDSQDVNYFEINFPVLNGMFGSPILDYDSGKIMGLICKNYRSQNLEDLHQENNSSYNTGKNSEETQTFKIIEYAKAVNLSKYEDFIKTFIKRKSPK